MKDDTNWINTVLLGGVLLAQIVAIVVVLGSVIPVAKSIDDSLGDMKLQMAVVKAQAETNGPLIRENNMLLREHARRSGFDSDVPDE